ncbi:MAG: hypothetical protein F6K16_38320 [Symploca sp. SIO2B6]|nr:hypothetical protein [Symploca sp. SIO2B6]
MSTPNALSTLQTRGVAIAQYFSVEIASFSLQPFQQKNTQPVCGLGE